MRLGLGCLVALLSRLVGSVVCWFGLVDFGGFLFVYSWFIVLCNFIDWFVWLLD